ncbi:MAG: hypothetical protein M3O35_09080 [Acidobacteriota bacterium]|nr:hypothetical protein [Acidobacteriota bacterium]
MKNKFILTSLLSAVALIGVANAQTGSGTLGVTATVQGSINLTFVTDASGLAVTGTGTSTASLPFGSVSMYSGTVPANVTKTIGATSFSLSTPFDVRVDLANSASTTYTLTATLATADSINTWWLGAIDISAAAPHALTAAGEFGVAVPYTFKLTVPASATAGLISNSINFTAVGG